MKKVNSLETNAYGHFMRPFFSQTFYVFGGKKERKKEKRKKERKKERK